jgi:lysophospholipase L1-like esterase
MPDKTIGELPLLETPLLGSDQILVSRDGENILQGRASDITARLEGSSAVSNWGTRIITLGSTFPNAPNSIFLGGTFLDNGTDSGTEHVAIEVGEFTAIRLIYQSASNTTPLIIKKTRVVAAADYSDKVQDAAFAASPVVGTYNGGAAGAYAPPGLQSNLVISDVIPITSVPRSDIPGEPPAVFIRTEFDLPQGANSVISSWDSSGTDWTSGDRKWFTAGAYGDKTTSALGRTPAATGRRILVGIQYLSPYKVMTVAVSGTSLTNNNTNTLARQPGGWHHRVAAALSTPTRPIEIANFGFSTQTSNQFRANFERLCQQIPATHYLIEGASVNDMSTGESAWSLAATDNCLRNVLACIERAQRLWKAKVGIWNGYPRGSNSNGGLTVNSDTRRLAYLAKLETLGYDLVDTNSLVTDGLSPQDWQSVAGGFPADLSGDDLHPNEAGDLRVATLGFQPLFERWASHYFTA